MAVDEVLDALKGGVAQQDLPSIYHAQMMAGMPFSVLIREWDHVPPTEQPWVESAVAAIRRDPCLSALAPDDKNGVFVSLNTGDGRRLWAKQIPILLIHAAARHVLAQDGSTEEIEPLHMALEDVVVRVRRLLAGEEDTGLLLVAFQGISLNDGQRLTLPGGLLRPASEFERKMQPFSNPEPTVVLERPISLRIQLGEPPRNGDPLSSNVDAFRLSGDHADQLCLAMILTLNGEPAPEWFWQTVVTPLGLGNGFRGRGAQTFGFLQPPAGPTLTESQQDELVEWSERIHRYFHPSITIAMRRTLSARGQRRNTEDSLIDAVIAWENLFGHGGNSEMVFRITTALAVLLEADPTQRSALRTELGKIYALRSRIAHGGVVKSEDSMNERRDRALEVVVQALQVLFSQKPYLISDRERGMKLILGIA